MKNRARRWLSVVLAASMLMGHGSVTTFAEGETAVEADVVVAAEEPEKEKKEKATEKPTEAPTEKPTEAPTEKPTEAPTEPPTEPPTEAPTEKPTEPPTEAPTEAPTEKPTEAPTEAPTEKPTEAPTEAPTEKPTEPPVQDGNADGLIETEMVETEAPVEKPTEALTETATEKVTEKVTEEITEEETEVKKRKFAWSEDGVNISVKLSKKDALAESAQMTVTVLTKKSNKKAWKAAKKLVEAEVNKGHRELSGARFYKIAFTVDGEPVKLSDKAEITITYEKALSLGLSKYAQPEAKAFALTEKSAKECADLNLNDSLKLKKAEFTVKDTLFIGFAGVQNRTNDGEEITQSGLEKAFDQASNYAVLANEYSGSAEETILAANMPMLIDEADEEEADPAEILESLAEYSLILANGKSSESVKVINLYTDKEGALNTEPIEEVMDEAAIDVSNVTLVINLVAGSAEQALKLPVYEAEYQGNPVEDEFASYAGRVIYNLVAEEEGEFISYLGEAVIDGEATGTYLAPKGSLKNSDGVLGAVYADAVSVEQVEMAVVGKDGDVEEVETEAETMTEEAAEAASEAVTEEVTEAASEAVAEEITEAASEAVTEETTEAASEIETEEVTEAVSETVTEEVTEAASETVTEEITEAVTETISEISSEIETETEFETETEGLLEETEQETETEILMVEENVELAEEELGAKEAAAVKPLPITKIEKTETASEPQIPVGPDDVTAPEETPVADAGLAVYAAEDIIAKADGKVRGKDGKVLSFTAGSTVYKKGAEIFSWTTDATGTPLDIAPYLLAGGSYVLRETATPEGYYKGYYDFGFSIDEKGIAKDKNGADLSAIKYENRAIPVMEDPENPGVTVPITTLSLKIAVLEKSEKKDVYLEGAKFVIKDSNGIPLKDFDGNQYSFVSEAKAMFLQLDPALFEVLAKELEENKTAKFYIAEIAAKSGYQIDGYSEVEVVATKDRQGNISLSVADDYKKDDIVVFYNKKAPNTAQGSLSVEKRIYFESSQICPQNGAVFYVALFADKEKTVRISDVKTLNIKKGKDTAKVVFEKLENGTYYVGETDEYGNLIGENRDPLSATEEFYAEYIWKSSKTDEVVIKSDLDKAFGADAETIALNNRYFELPEEDYSYTAPFKVKVEVKDENGNPLKVRGSFKVGLLTKQTGNKKASSVNIALDSVSSKTSSYKLTMGTSTDTNKNLYAGHLVATNNNGKVTYSVQQTGQIVKGGVTFNISVSPSYIKLKAGQEAPTITVTYTRVPGSTEPETDTNATIDPNNMKAELKLTKKVVYKKTPIRVNSVYYIGIFDDAALTKLRFKKAMTFTDASELTATLKVNLNKVATNEVTFYFAEVDEEGKVLKSGKEFGYDISLNKNSVTLNLQNMADEVIVTNSVREGEKVQQQLNDPTSGFAGGGWSDNGWSGGGWSDGATPLADAQNLASSDNSSENTKTGDDNPILQLIIILVVSVVVIAAVIVFLIVQRNNRRRNARRRDRRDRDSGRDYHR